MRNVGIHVLDFNDNIIDFISQSDGALINAEMSMNVEEKTETFDFTIENTRAEKLRERNRIIAQDNNGTFKEFIIIHITDNFDGTTEIECNASYLEDLKTAKPIKPGKFEAHTTTQALLKTLADTGWEVSDDTEYGGNRTTSWTSHTNPFDLIYMLCTTYSMAPSFYIELGAHTVEHRYVSITKPKNLFKGKEITKGKDLTGMTRTIDLSEVKTALLAVGPEKEDGSRIETVVVDDEAQEIFGLPNRYIWDVYEPETEDENMTLKRLTTLAKTELNKRNQAAISYEVSSIDIHKYYNDVTVDLRDIVRVKDRDFRPPLYIEAEVIGIKYNWLADESEFTFGNVIEYEETKLREFFNRKLDEITKKLNDNISNVNTIVSDVVAGELEYYERKIFKGAEPPENPQNDTLWYDTSNPDVAVLRRYWDGKWITQTADDVEKIGGLRREQVMYRDLNNSFINLTIQHSRLQNDVYDVLNNEYLVDDDLKANLNQALSDVDNVYQNIKTNLDSMDEDTATIGKLVDTQTLFAVYREKLQTLYKYVTDAKISIDKRLKLLQSQYTDEKFNETMQNVATGIGGTWNAETGQLLADIPSQQELEDALKAYINGQDEALKQLIDGEVNSKIIQTKDELSSNISEVSAKVDGIQVGGRNLVLKSDVPYSNSNYLIADYTLSKPMEVGKTYTVTVKGNVENSNGGLAILRDNGRYFITSNADKISDELYKVTFEANKDTFITDNIRLYNYPIDTRVRSNIEWVKLEEGNMPTDWTPAPEDTQKAAQVYTDEMLEPITSTQIQQSSDIKQLKDGFTLKADKKDITTLYDDSIAPLERQVNNNSSELKIQSDKIDSKVSNEQYTADVDDIISKLNSAESQRIQLSNQIADKVSLIEYKNGIDSVKSTNRNYLQSYYSTTQNSTSGITKGPYYVELNAYQRINFYFYDRNNGGNPSLKQNTDYILKVHESSPDIKIGIFYKKGSYTIAGYTTDKVIRFNTGNREDILIIAISQSNDQYIGKISLYEGTKELDWSPAPEDIELLGLTAENNAKSYIDDYKNENETKLKLMNTEINQNGQAIQLKASQQDFNASRKTLSQVISEISATTKGINLSYDENGNIQSYTMDRNGIQLRGDKVDITVNKDFNVMASKVDDKVGKNEVVNRLNLSPEGLDINVNNIGIRGGDSVDYLDIRNNSILSYGSFTRTWANETDTANLRLGIQGGTVKVQNRTTGYNLYLTEKGLSTMLAGAGDETAGTLEFHSTKYNDTSRGVRLHSTYGAVALESDYSRIILNANLTVNIESNYGIYFRPYRDNRTGNNEFAMYVKQNDSGAYTDGVLKYGNVSSDTSQYGSGIRFSKSSINSTIYATNKDGDIGTGHFFADKLYGDLTAKGSNAYILVDDALRITDKKGYNNGNVKYKDLQCLDVQANSIRVNTAKDFYIGVSTNELRVTNNLFWNGGDTGYKPVRASAFNNASLEQYKTDIKKWDYDALTVIANDLDLYQFKYKNEEGKEKGLNHRGVIIGRDYKTPDEFIYGDGVNIYEMVTWALRSIQQLNEKTNTLEEQLNEQSITS
ncbi:phage tail spike protein [Staphylococcus hominis]|uniref:phage tail spike protein n=1 Tax=Staphylococcus hominis TaxID=1290 RepID=UPI002E1844E4|nr:phage tail spike protein [Staphylococcus hominis]MEC5415087.1 phage tail spike protein [Staphylococcus hominis]